MSVITDFAGMRGLTEESAALKLLRARNAPAILAIIGNRFDEAHRIIAVPEFEGFVEADLAEISQRLDVPFERSAHDYCEDWRKDGYLVRRVLDQGRQEGYEPSPDAMVALAFVRGLREPRRVATESRLATIVDRIGTLALAIDANVERRSQELLRKREEIDRELRELELGRVETMDEDRAVEAVLEIIALAEEVPLDFGRVRQDLEEINASLYETIINEAEGSEDILDDVFAGVDRISSSPSGTSFRAFYELLGDVNRSETLEDETRAILEHPLAEHLTPAQRIFLRDLMRILRRRSEEVDDVRTAFARGLRRFVQNRNYQQDRILKRSIDHALALARQLVESAGLRADVSQSLDLSGVSMKPVSALGLRNPMESRSAEVVEASGEESSVSYEVIREIARQSEIDFVELADNVNRCLEERAAMHEVGADAVEVEREPVRWVSVGDVLGSFPATQGVASVIGLMTLALEQGELGDGTEEIAWSSRSGVERRASIGQLRFYEEVTPL